MASIFDDIRMMSGIPTFPSGLDSSFITADCAHCGVPTNHAVIAFVYATRDIQWIRCGTCKRGAVIQFGQQYPAVSALRTPNGLPDDATAGLWEDIRKCYGVRAWGAVVMLCRKMVFHVAVDKGLAPKNAKGWAPKFAEALQHIEDEGHITKQMRDWTNRIVEIGNEANHEIPAITEKQAEDVAAYTLQLLTLVYAIPALADQTDPATP